MEDDGILARQEQSVKGARTLKITRIDCHVLLDPHCDVGSTSSAQDDIVVEIHTDEFFVLRLIHHRIPMKGHS